MNYTIGYPSVTMNVQSQRAIVLTPPAAVPQSTSTNLQQSFPMVMQMGSTSGPVFYTYQNEAHNKSNDSCLSVLLSPVSPVQNSLRVLKNNGNSPTVNIQQSPSENKNATARALGELLTTVNIQQSPVENKNTTARSLGELLSTVNIQQAGAENKNTTARSLGELFNVQSVGNIPNQPTLVQMHSVPATQQNSSNQSEIASLLSSMQTSILPVAITPDTKCDQAFDGIPEMYKVVDASGNITVFTTGVTEPTVQGATREQFTIPSTTLDQFAGANTSCDQFAGANTVCEQLPVANTSPVRQKSMDSIFANLNISEILNVRWDELCLTKQLETSLSG